MENETDKAPDGDTPSRHDDKTTPDSGRAAPDGQEGTETLTGRDSSSREGGREATESLAATLLTPDSNRAPLIGTQVGNYRVLSVLGGGGFGTVYMAEDLKLSRTVALKFLRNPLESKHRELFEREAKAIAKLSKHGSIVQIYEWGEHQGQSYFALEYVESSADKVLSEHPEGLPIPLAMQIVAEVAEGLDYAHEQGILHRDVKPANILVEADDGAAKISDFGLTRFYESSLASTTGGISGSPPYMSPEQASGGRVDRRSDVFSLGTTLYELLCGQRPFTGASQFEVIDRIRRNKRTPLKKHKPNLPRFLLGIVDKATAHNPNQRFQTAAEMAQALHEALSALEAGKDARTIRVPGAPPTGGSTQLRFALAAGCVVLAAVAFAFLWQTSRMDEPANTPLADAERLMNLGKVKEAEAAYRDVLNTTPEDDEAVYGLGYALLQQGDVDAAQQEFSRIHQEGLRVEGDAAVKYESKGNDARPALESARNKTGTAYPDVLLSTLDVAGEQYPQAAERLASLNRGQLNFTWQYAQGLQTLGQAYYRMGDYANARSAFQHLQTILPEREGPLAGAYLELTERQLDSEHRARISKQIEQIKNLMEQGTEASTEEVDLWTSRPLRFVMLPAEPGKSRLAMNSGLVDVLPWMLGTALEKQTSLELVNRELLSDILAEQELSAQLSTKSGQIALGQVLGARLLVQCDFGSLQLAAIPEDFVVTTVVDTETTRDASPDERVKLARPIMVDELVSELAAAVQAAVDEAYPLRGKLAKQNRALFANIGADVGVEMGMRFAVSPEPDPTLVMPDKFVVVEGPVGLQRAGVRTEGFEPGDIPEEGWYIVHTDD